jgi:phosphoserine phosphatase
LSVHAIYPLVVFDLDGTLVDHPEPIWKTLHERLGSDPEQRRATIRAAMSGKITYAEWFATDLKMLREAGANRAAIERIIDTLSPTPGAISLVDDLRRAGARVALVSGGLDMIRRRILPSVEFDAIHINRISFSDDGEILDGTPTAYDRGHKVSGIRALTERFGVSIEQTAFVGDGSNDVYAAKEVGCSIAWSARAHPELVEVSDHHVIASDMDALRPLLFRELSLS